MLRQRLIDAYFSLVLDRPWVVLGAVLVAVLLFGFFSRGFELDASAESLVLEDDEDLRHYLSLSNGLIG